MLDGAARIAPLIESAAEQGMPAIAITDHGNVHGAYEFWEEARKKDIKAIIGTEAYLTPGTHRSSRTRERWGDGGEDDISGGGAYTHMTLLSETTEGMHNLFKLSSYSSLEGFYYKPRMDRELLQNFSKGLIATTGCPGGEVQTRLRLGQYKEAMVAAADFRDIFGKDNFFVELMDHGITVEKRTRDDLLKLSRELDIPLLATNDLHYVHQEDHEAQATMLCVQSGSTLDDENRFKFDGTEYYLKSAKQMREIFRELPEACDNTLLIAERVNVEFQQRDLMPKFPVPAGETEATWFEKEVWEGLRKRLGGAIPEEYRSRADYEIGIITSMGFPSYFLVVSDFIGWAKQQGIRVGPGRGSAAGSVVSWALRITELDPIAHGLYFERFLNPERIEMPDIDIDFDDRRRGEVITYVTERYGEDRVAQIATFGTIKAKQALKDAARVMGEPFSTGDRLTKAMPPDVQGKGMALTEIFDPNADRYKEASEMRALVEEDQTFRRVFDRALGIEGLKRQSGVHAAGVLMSSEPLIEVVPLMKREDDGAIITQFDQPPLVKLGLLKMDFLGLRNLTVLTDALSMIKENHGIDIALEDLPLDGDEKVFRLLANAETVGVFQLEGVAMRALLRLLKPTRFADIVAVNALFRPGPMGIGSHTNYALRKNGLQKVDPIHPELDEPLGEILEDTYGLIVYQEQVMEAARKVAGFSLGQADILRKAMGKKLPNVLAEYWVEFEAGATANGFSKNAATALWDALLPFAGYAFNKAHSACYAVISYWTAYLKVHYPAEYMAALLTSVGASKDKLAPYLSECRKMGIEILPPDVNESVHDFRAVNGKIRFGLGAVKNVGHHAISGIIQAREIQGAYTDFHDFLRKSPTPVLQKRTIECLIKGGAFDSFGHTRRSLLEIHSVAVDTALSLKRNEESGQGDLFGGVFDFVEEQSHIPASPEWIKRDLLRFEREMLGLYVSDHPLAGLENLLARNASQSIAELMEVAEDSAQVTVAGLVTSVNIRTARKSGNQYAQVVVEDFSGEISIMFMGKTYQEFAPALDSDTIVAIRGRVNVRDEEVTVNAYSMTLLENSASANEPVVIQIQETKATPDLVQAVGDILIRHPGDNEVRMKLIGSSGVRMYEIPYAVKITPDLYGEIKSLLGAESIS